MTREEKHWRAAIILALGFILALMIATCNSGCATQYGCKAVHKQVGFTPYKK